MRVLNVNLGPTEGAVTSKRIIQDVGKCTNQNLLAIIAAKGAGVQGLGNRNGHRSFVKDKGQRGGPREKKAPAEQRWIHPDAQGARLDII